MSDYFVPLLRIVLSFLVVQSTVAQQPSMRNSSITGRRMALVIGNTGYPSMPVPPGVLDARAMEQVLRKLNFDVASAMDVTRKQLAESVEQFAARLQPNDVAVFYYSGHGISLGGENYLVGTDFAGRDEYDIRYDGYPLAWIQERIERSEAALGILIIEASHENPFNNAKTTGRGLGAERSGRGTFLAFASEPSTVSVDVGPTSNSLFTARLLETLNQPGLTLDELFNRVRADVIRATNGRQVPIQVSSMTGSFYFIPPPGSANSAFDQGLHLLKAKKPHEAIPYFDLAIGIDPSCLAAYVRRAEAFRLVGDDSHSQIDLDTAIRLKPIGSDGYLHRAMAYMSEFRFERALADLNYSIKLNKDADHAHQLRAEVLDHLGEWEAATLDYDEAIRSTPNELRLYRARGIDRVKIREYALAIDDLTKVINHGADAESYLSRSAAFSGLDRSDLALADLRDASQLGSSDPAEHMRMGNSFLELGDVDSAEKEFRSALQLKPDDDVVLNAVGYTLADRGIKLTEALSLIERAVQLDQNNYAYLDSLGWVYYRLKQLDKAEKYLKMSLDLQTSPEQLEHLGDVYWSEGRKVAAANEWREALATLERAKIASAAQSDQSTREPNKPPTQVVRLRNKLQGIK